MKKLYRNPWFFITAALIIPVMAFTSFEWLNKKFSALPVLKEMKSVETPLLYNQRGVPVQTFGPGRGIIVANFFFTHCPVVCSKMTNELKRVNSAFPNDAPVSIVSFSVDPERDSMERLNGYISKMKIDASRWEFVTGDKSTIYQLARNNFGLVAADGAGPMPDFIHSEQLVLLDAQLRIRGYYNGTDAKQTDLLINDIKKLQNEPSNFSSR